MGEPNNVLKVYMQKPDRIRSVLEYFFGMKLSRDWTVEIRDGFYAVKNEKGKISFRERDIIKCVPYRMRLCGKIICTLQMAGRMGRRQRICAGH